MTAVLLHFMCAATVFLEQDIPGLRFLSVDPLTGALEANYRHADLDRDGRTDLLFTDRVLFQRDGLYPAGSTAALPEMLAGTLGDTADDTIYLRYPGGLKTLTWDEDGWSIGLEQSIDWPDLPQAPPTEGENTISSASPLSFDHFLIDVDDDGINEIVVYARDGVHLYRKQNEFYSDHTVLNLYPQATATTATSGPVWPPELRRLSIPGQRLNLSAIWRGSTLTMVSRQELLTDKVKYRSRAYDVLSETNTNPLAIEEVEYPLMPTSMRPVFLNADDTLDFAGGAAVLSAATAFTEPIYDTFATTNQGDTIRRFRTKAFAPRSNFVDVDGDGDIDVITHRTHITSGGLRESLNRYFFQRSIGHQVSFLLQDDSGRFELAPRLSVDLSIQLEKVPYREGSMFRRYRSGDLIDVTGDFNGDGYKDLIVQESAESLAIFISRGYRYSKHPIFFLTVQKNERFYVADVDGNGMADVILIRPATDRAGDRSRVYFARQTGP